MNSPIDTATIAIQGIPLELALIPAGTFLMGSPPGPDLEEWECPHREVNVRSFWMGTYPITQAQWRAVAAFPPVNLELNPDPSRFKGYQRPVERITWFEAMEFCDRLSAHIGQEFQLPSEAAWEYACRAGTTTAYHFGDTITPEVANYDGHYQGTTDVGTFSPNAFGLYDMHGNVAEWCLDTTHKCIDAPTDGSAYIDLNARDDSGRSARGGGWRAGDYLCRAATRGMGPGNQSADGVGFRVVMAL